MTYFTHRIRPDYRCSGCGRHLIALMRLTRWVGNTVTPVCADADLAFLMSEKCNKFRTEAGSDLAI